MSGHKSTQYDKEGLPENLIENQRVKVTSKAEYSAESGTLLETMKLILDEIRLSNLLFKEAFRIEARIEDIDNED